MSGQHHVSESECPTCGHDAAIVRVRGNAFSSVCERCGRADVTPLLDADDLLATEGERYEAELFELDAIRYGDPTPLQQLSEVDVELQRIRGHMRALGDSVRETLPVAVELRLPVPPR